MLRMMLEFVLSQMERGITKEEIISRASKLNIGLKCSIKDLVRDADLIFSTVTAEMKKIKTHGMKLKNIFNSATPEEKKEPK